MQLNNNEIKNLAHSNEPASAIFLALSQRERARKALNLEILRHTMTSSGVAVKQKDFYGVFKALEALGAGDLLFGRNGNPNLFVWKYDLKDIAKIGLGESKLKAKPASPSKSRKIIRKSPVNTPETSGIPKGYMPIYIPISLFSELIKNK